MEVLELKKVVSDLSEKIDPILIEVFEEVSAEYSGEEVVNMYGIFLQRVSERLTEKFSQEEISYKLSHFLCNEFIAKSFKRLGFYW